MKLGAEPKKVAALGGLILFLAIYLLWPSSSPGPSGNSSPRAAAPTSSPGVAAPTGPAAPASTAKRPNRGNKTASETRPSLRPKRPGEGPATPADVDPTLRLDLLAKLQAVPPARGERNLFEFGSAPAPAATDLPKVPKIPVRQQAFVGPPAPPKPAPPPPPPTAPPIPLKFYGYSARQNGKRAFFLDGEDVLVGTEGAVLKGRYKIIRIGVNSVVMEDQQFHQQQTLALEPEQAGA